MPLNIKNAEVDSLARQLSILRGRSITEVVHDSLQDSLTRETARRSKTALSAELAVIGRRCAALPDLDCRTPEEIIGYDEIGVPR